MTFLPIIERELRVRARSRAAYWTRFAVALLGMVVCLPHLISSGPFRGPASIGHDLLNAVVGAAFLVSCAACLLTADIISSERREGTLGLLLLTRVRLFDVLAGKLGSAGLTSLCALIAFLPTLMIPVLAGGVTGGEAFRKGLALLDTLFLALAAGLWASARGHEWVKTGRNALLVMAVIVLAPYPIGLLFSGLSAAANLILLSPLGTLRLAGDVMYKVAAAGYWISLLLVQALGWALMAGAVVRLRRGWREDRGEVAVPAPPATCASDLRPARPSCARLGDRMNPIAWLLRRQGGVKAILWVGALVGLSHYWIFPLAFRFVSPTLSWGWVSPLNLALAVLSGALFAWAASRYFVAARRTGELELLLTTPLGATQIVTTQWAVLKRGLRWPLVLMIVPAILQTAVVLRYMGGASGPAYPYGLHYAVSGLISCVNIVFGAWALCWLGMWFGLRSGRQGQAIAWTVTLAKGLPYLIGILSWALFAALANPPVRTRSSPYWIMTWLPQVLDLLVYLALIRFARRRLQGGLAAPELVNFDLRASTLAMARDTGSAWRKVRHWTPS